MFSMFKIPKALSCFLIILIVLFTAAGCSSNNDGNSASFIAPRSDTLRLSATNKVQTIDPAYVRSQMELYVCSLVFEGLVKLDGENILPALATDWSISDNGLEYTFNLNPDAVFHNGDQLRADDVKFSWERVIRYRASTAYVFSHIEGYDAVYSGATRELSGVTAVGNHTLRVRLKTAQPNFLSGLSHITASVLNRLELVNQGEKFAKPSQLFQTEADPLPSGTGPYRFGEWVGNHSISLGRFQEYYGGQAELRRVELNLRYSTTDALIYLYGSKLNGVLNVDAQSGSDRDLINKGFKVISDPVRTINYLVCSSSSEPFNNELVRRAVFEAVSGTDIIDKGLGGNGVIPAKSFSDYWYSLEDIPSVQIKTDNNANSLLAMAGYGGEDGRSLPALVLDCGPNQTDKAIAQAIADTLNSHGFRVTVKANSYSELRQLVLTGNTSFYLGEFTDKGGGLDTFYLEVVDSRWQAVIPGGSWSEYINQGYGAQVNKQAYFSLAEEALKNQGILCFLAYQKQRAVLGAEWDDILILNNGGVFVD